MDEEAGETDDYRELYDEIREEIYAIVCAFTLVLGFSEAGSTD